MANHVILDAMIPREDMGREGEDFTLDLFKDFPISHLAKDSPHLKLMRKPDFQRETNHWTPSQVATFIASFLDNEIIPGLILWKSPSYVFVIDGGHRLSALRAWMEDDYGDGAISSLFYGPDIPDAQKAIARKTRALIEKHVGRFSSLKATIGNKNADELQRKRADRLFTRAIQLQWIQGNASVAETSFFKVNSQGTPLDETETKLIKNRNKPIAICARAILRAGAGHRYWRRFPSDRTIVIEQRASEFYKILFQPEIAEPLRTLDVPVGGSVSPVDALALLIEFVAIAGTRVQPQPTISDYDDDSTGDATIKCLENALAVLKRIVGNSAQSLGLHPAVYFYNARGKYSRFMFLGITMLLTDKLRDNDDNFFKKFTKSRRGLERFLMDNRSLLGIMLQNMGKTQRVPKLRDLFVYLVDEYSANREVTPEMAMSQLGLRGRIVDVVSKQSTTKFSDDTKSMVFLKKALESALICPVCGGVLDPNKSVSYDHVLRVRDGGTAEPENCDLAHPFCNTGVKN
ncbi:MAG: DUF262 domain-containing protein [Fimbriimonadaceae bacterium]|nr:DUF262 domain-containing protein [Fimbriimonadaceae bacterium]